MADTPDKQDKKHFKIGQFEGPLDLLLFLIKKSEVNIYDIPISEITEQYLSYLSYIAHEDLNNLTEFYLMASTLLYIKSRMLLPVEVDMEDIEDPRMELVEKLIEYQKFRKLSELMMEQEKAADLNLERTKDQRSLPFPEDDQLWIDIDVWDLLKNFSKLVKDLTPERIINLYEEVSINEKVSLLNEILEEKKECSFLDLIKNPESVMDVVCAFLAVLDSVKFRSIKIMQNKLFGDIRIIAADKTQVDEEYESE
ncbi:MAG: segregation and condensation protein A [Spirochaetia bacterium]